MQVFKRNDISAYIALLIVAVLCKFKFFLHPSLLIMDISSSEALFFELNGLRSFQVANPLINAAMCILLQFVFAIVVNTAVMNHKLFPQKNVLVALSFILITSFFSEFNYFSVAFISTIFVLTAFNNLLKLSATSKPRQCSFNIGIFISLATFFYFPTIILLIVFLFFIWLLRPFILQELFAYILGFATTYYVVLAFLYLNGKYINALSHLNHHFTLPVQFLNSWTVIIFISVIISLLIVSIIVSGRNIRKEPMIVRKKWRLVYGYLLFATLASLLSSKFPSVFFIIALTPFSILLSQSFNNHKEKWNIFTLFFILISILGVQWILIK